MYEVFEFLHCALYVICVELKYFYVFVFCFGGILFLSCVTMCRSGGGACVVGMVKSWDGWCWGGLHMDVCVMGICGGSRDV